MEKIVLSIQNGLLSEAIFQMLTESGEFEPFRSVSGGKKNDVATSCVMMDADILLSEVSYASGTTLKVRLQEAKEVRERLPKCKIVFLCDENATPDIAREIMLAKKDGKINAFFYSSVTAKYLLAALASL